MIMGILSGNPTNEPMHYGEVFATWTALQTVKGAIAAYQTKLNHIGDNDLYKLMEDMISQGKQEEKQLEQLLKDNGVGLPPAPPDRPKAKLEEIPIGARFQDPEIAAAIARDNSMALVSASQVMGQCIREDIAMMFGQFHTEKATFGARILRLNKEKGWLIPPPLHHSQADEEK